MKWMAILGRVLAFVALAGCGDGKQQVSEAPTAVTPATPDAVRAVSCRPIKEEPFHPKHPDVIQLAWLTSSSFVAVIIDHTNPREGGIAIFDSRANTRSLFRIQARQLAVRDERTLLIVQDDRVAVFDLAASCVRESERLEIQHAAIDAKRGRFFVQTKASALFRLDDVALKQEVAAPRNVKKLAYDATSDRLIVRTYSPTVELYSAELQPAGTITLPKEPRIGPWVHHGEVWFTTDTYCEHREFDAVRPERKSLGKCLDDPKTVGTFLRRYELPSGKLVETLHFMGGDSMLGEDTSSVSFSGDRKVMIAAGVSEAHLQVIGGASTYLNKGHTYTWGNGQSFPVPLTLDETGARFIGDMNGGEVGIRETTTGKQLWSYPIPRGDPYAP
jgi:hypothetical protein